MIVLAVFAMVIIVMGLILFLKVIGTVPLIFLVIVIIAVMRMIVIVRAVYILMAFVGNIEVIERMIKEILRGFGRGIGYALSRIVMRFFGGR